MSTLKTVIMGADGRMGRVLIQQVLADPQMELWGGIEGSGNPALGQDLGRLAGLDEVGIKLTDDLLPLAKDADIIIDFSRPAATCEAAALAAQARIVHVIGTTGLEAEDDAKLAAAARHATIIKSGNFSLGVNLVAAMAKKLAHELGEDFDAEIVEMHHRYKVDAPSGTALLLGEAVADGRGIALGQAAVRGRDGITGERERGQIGFAALRGGAVVGEHTVLFCADDERIELTHKAGDRSIFARGALRAAKWGQGRGPGLYSMADVLGI